METVAERRPDADRAEAVEVDETPRGLVVAEVARRYRVSPAKVRGWIKRGELPAINTARGRLGRPRYVVPPEALAAFERVQAAATVEPPRRARRPAPRRLYDNADPKAAVDHYPDDPGEAALVKSYRKGRLSREELAKAVRQLRR